MSPEKQKASKRLNYEILKMKQYMLKHQICNTEIAKKSGITALMFGVSLTENHPNQAH